MGLSGAGGAPPGRRGLGPWQECPRRAAGCGEPPGRAASPAQSLRPAMPHPQRIGELAGAEAGGPARGRLAPLWILPLTLSGLLGVAWGASGLGAPHLHHFHGSGSSKHPSVPIAIYRSPASLRGGAHGGCAEDRGRGGSSSSPGPKGKEGAPTWPGEGGTGALVAPEGRLAWTGARKSPVPAASLS